MTFPPQIKRPFYIICIVCVCIHYKSVSQNNFDYQNVSLQSLDTENGLSQSTVFCILKDSEGFIWIGTDDGLNRYDGNEFKVYRNDKNDSTTISGNLIRTLYEDSQKRLWVGTFQNGLNLYDREKGQFIRYKSSNVNFNSLSEGSVIDMVEGPDHNFWIGTYWGLNRFNPKTNNFTHFLEESGEWGVGGNQVLALRRMGDKMLIGHDKGLSIMDFSTLHFRHFHHNPNDPTSITPGLISDIFQDSKGRIWLASKLGVDRFLLKEEKFIHYNHIPGDPTSIHSEIINVIYEDFNGNIWFGTDGGGISIYDDSLQHFVSLTSQKDPSFSKVSAYTIFDDGKAIWVGTFGEGIKQVRKYDQGFVRYVNFHPQVKKLGKNSILAFEEDKKGNIWIGTDGSGLYKMNPKKGSFEAYVKNHHEPNNSLSSNVVKSLMFDQHGKLYIGTYAGGLNVLDPETGSIKKYQAKPLENSLVYDNVWALHEDDLGRIWIGTLLGLNLFDPSTKTFTYFHSDHEDSTTYNSGTTFGITSDSEGNIWFATADGVGKFLEETQSFKRYNIRNSQLSGDYVKDMFEEKPGVLYALTSQGIDRYDYELDDFVPVPLPDQLLNNIQSVLVDDEGEFWMGTFNGLCNWNPETGKYRQYDPAEGLQGKEYNPRSRFISSTGDFYLGGLNGFNVFKPEEIKTDTVGPKLVLSGLSLFHKPVESDDASGILHGDINFQEEIVFDYGQSVFSIHYSALDFYLPKVSNYAYMLKGFDKDWNYVGGEKSATYTNLASGEYTFIVKAANKDGYWSENPKEITIIVKPPFWETLWFRTLAALAGIGAIFMVIKLRTRSIEKNRKLLMRHVSERTKELRQEIKIRIRTESELREALDKLKETQNQLVRSEKMASLGILTTGISHEMNNPLNFIAGGINIIQNELDDETDKDRSELLKSLKENLDYGLSLIQKGFDRSSQIVRSLTSWSNKEQPTLIQTDVSKMFNYLIDSLSRNVETNIEWVTTYHMGPIYVYPDRLFQVFKNILENAIYATTHHSNPHHPKIIIETGHYEKTKVHITISNTGDKLNEDEFQKIFDPFYTTKEPGDGTGLGLALCYSFVDQHLGSIKVKNTEDGVSFCVILPIRLPKEAKEKNLTYTKIRSRV